MKINNFLSKHSYFQPEDFEPGGLRTKGDFSAVQLAMSNNSCRLFCHSLSLFDEVIIEIHRERNSDDELLLSPATESFALTPGDRFDLAMYLLSTITVAGD